MYFHNFNWKVLNYRYRSRNQNFFGKIACLSDHALRKNQWMDFDAVFTVVLLLVLTLHITQVFTKSRSKSKSKKYETSSSDEDSIENLLYFKDCQRKGQETTTAEAVPLRYEAPPPPPPPRQPDCPFPKMCCSLTCGNECGSQPGYVNRQMEPMQNNIQPIQPIQPMAQPRQPGMGGVQPQLVQRRKKKLKFQPNKMPPMLGTRRDFSGFTKEKIKSLISQDDDIRKILKDLVRVTMQKVDLLDIINSRRNNNEVNTQAAPTAEMPFDEYDEL